VTDNMEDQGVIVSRPNIAGRGRLFYNIAKNLSASVEEEKGGKKPQKHIQKTSEIAKVKGGEKNQGEQKKKESVGFRVFTEGGKRRKKRKNRLSDHIRGHLNSNRLKNLRKRPKERSCQRNRERTGTNQKNSKTTLTMERTWGGASKVGGKQ